jgi:hypothetical protein
MAIKIGESTINQRLEEARLEVRRLAAAHAIAQRKYNDYNDNVRSLVLTAAMKAEQEKLLKVCQELWDELDIANDVVRWMTAAIDSFQGRGR